MSEQDIRLKCLELAAHFYGPGEPPPEYLLFKLADSYLSYVKDTYSKYEMKLERENYV